MKSPRKEADKGSIIFYQKYLEMKPCSWPQERKSEMGGLHRGLSLLQPRSNMYHFSHFFTRNIQMILPKYNALEKTCLPCDRKRSEMILVITNEVNFSLSFKKMTYFQSVVINFPSTSCSKKMAFLKDTASLAALTQWLFFLLSTIYSCTCR